jgi:voltage-gated sodium channel
MTKEQHDWQFIVRLIVHLKPREQNHGSNSSIRLFFCAIINHPWFSWTVNTIICINMFVMMANQHDDSDCTLTNFFWLDVFFASFFLLEAILNLVALGASWYFSNVWNIFDFIVVASSIFSATIDYLSGYHSCPIQAPQAQSQYFQDIGQIVGFFKIIRVLRILRLLRLLKGVRRMLDSLITSLPSLASVASLLLLLMGIFAVLSANLFSNVSSGRELLRNGFGGSESHNYQNFYNSFRMLFRFLTGEAWPSTMSDAMQV